MPHRKTPMTLAEHQTLGRELDAQLHMLRGVLVRLSERYSSAGKECRAAHAAIRKVSALRSALDDAVCRETPRDVHACPDGTPITQVYYRAAIPLPTEGRTGAALRRYGSNPQTKGR